MNVISFGGGTNSTAMLIGMYEKEIPVDLILFADTGGEFPHTYKHVETMSVWLQKHGLPEITTVKYNDKDGNRMTLEMECLKSKTLPAIAYGYKKCSLKHKRSVQDKYCNNLPACRDTWNNGNKVTKYIGFDAGEEKRIFNARMADMVDQKYDYVYALYDWGWWRDDCIEKIKEHGIPLPGKSSCFFCPSMKRTEILKLKRDYPELLKRAIAIEENAKENLITVKGLGRDFSWKNFIDNYNVQGKMCIAYDDGVMPCGCYDG